MQLPNQTLYFLDNSSDKVYQAQVAETDGGFVVNYQYGRRGAALRNGSKTSTPVTLEQAIEIHRKLIASKIAAGYTPVEGGAAYQSTEHAGRVTGLAPHLLNPVDENEAERLLDDGAFYAQQKFNGERRGVLLRDSRVQGSNKLGLEVALPVSLVAAVRALAAARGHTALDLDGEIIGETLYVFDVLRIEDLDLAPRPLDRRTEALEHLFAALPVEHRGALVVADTARSREEKRALLAAVSQASQEGIVFKRSDAPYVPGRPASGGDQLKFKLWESATLIAGETREGKRSVSLFAVGANDERVPFGNVTVPSNHEVPAPAIWWRCDTCTPSPMPCISRPT